MRSAAHVNAIERRQRAVRAFAFERQAPAPGLHLLRIPVAPLPRPTSAQWREAA